MVREITPSDIALLETERGVKPSQIQRLSDRHHALARCLAAGLSTSDACAITGYTPSRISILKGDPSFENLIAFYREGKADLVLDIGQQMLSNAKEAAVILGERLEDKPDEFSADALLDIQKAGADRNGHGPQSRNTNVNIHMNLADRLSAARKRVGAPPEQPRGDGKLIEGTVAPTISPGDTDENNG